MKRKIGMVTGSLLALGLLTAPAYAQLGGLLDINTDDGLSVNVLDDTASVSLGGSGGNAVEADVLSNGDGGSVASATVGTGGDDGGIGANVDVLGGGSGGSSLASVGANIGGGNGLADICIEVGGNCSTTNGPDGPDGPDGPGGPGGPNGPGGPGSIVSTVNNLAARSGPCEDQNAAAVLKLIAQTTTSPGAVAQWQGPVDVQLIGLCGPIKDQAMNLAALNGVDSVHGAASSNPVIVGVLQQYGRSPSDILTLGTDGEALRIYVR